MKRKKPQGLYTEIKPLKRKKAQGLYIEIKPLKRKKAQGLYTEIKPLKRKKAQGLYISPSPRFFHYRHCDSEKAKTANESRFLSEKNKHSAES